MLPADATVVLLQHHGLDNLRGKTGLAMLRYRKGPIPVVVDPAHAGANLRAITGIPRSTAVVGSLREALPLLAAPEQAVAVVGLAPSGGALPVEMRDDLLAALDAGMSLASGLHTPLGRDPDLAARLRPGAWIWDLRQEPRGLSVATAQAAQVPGHRLLAVGTDMSVGKMSACLELQAAALRRGLDARFVATGQAGILISGAGVPLDAIRVDYAAGGVEEAVLAAAAAATPRTLLLVEGQGSLCHPGSTATLPLLRGSQPTALLLVHRAGQTSIRTAPHIPIPPLAELIAVVEALAALGRPATTSPAGMATVPERPAPKVGAIALNTAHLSAEEARLAMEEVGALTGLPCADPVRQGGEALLDAFLNEALDGLDTGRAGRASEGIRTPV
ncbi:MAG: DUF1611 domain-containing protein [Cyanobacteriota bacterium]|nr:DUF1611 domain-containing protein [Cyanobacteriota bacterium]